jgi:hypothetical protein
MYSSVTLVFLGTLIDLIHEKNNKKYGTHSNYYFMIS